MADEWFARNDLPINSFNKRLRRPIRRTCHSCTEIYRAIQWALWIRGLWREGVVGRHQEVASLRLLDVGLNNLLSGEEVPHSASVELISKWVEESVEDGICLCYNWEHLQAETVSVCWWWLMERFHTFLYCNNFFLKAILVDMTGLSDNDLSAARWLSESLIDWHPSLYLEELGLNDFSPFSALVTQPWRSRSRRRCTWGRKDPSTSALPSGADWY